MKTLNYLGTFGLIVLPIAIAILTLGTYFVIQVITHNLYIY